MTEHCDMKPSGLSWAPQVPAHWTIKKLGFVVSLQSGNAIAADDILDSGPYPVYGGNGIRGYSDRFTHSGHYVLIGRQGALCGNVHYAEGDFWASEHAVVATPKEEIDVCWLGELLRGMNLNQYSISAAQPGLAVDTIAALRIPVPPLTEQRAIADFLGRENARLDALVKAKERLLDVLAEKRQALISHAVTRGLNPDVPLRDSGIPWLGQIPAHWKTERAKWLFTERNERSETGEEELLTVSHLTGVTRRSEKEVYMFEAETTEGYKISRQGDLVINTLWAWMGAMGVSSECGIVSPAYHVYTPCSLLGPEYIEGIVRVKAFAEEAMRFSKGVWSSRLRLYPEGFFEIWMPVPPLEEQQSIVNHIQSEEAKIEALCAVNQRSIQLLNERRTAVISAAVTGQMEVN